MFTYKDVKTAKMFHESIKSDKLGVGLEPAHSKLAASICAGGAKLTVTVPRFYEDYERHELIE